MPGRLHPLASSMAPSFFLNVFPSLNPSTVLPFFYLWGSDGRWVDGDTRTVAWRVWTVAGRLSVVEGFGI
ncbi:CusA/CzcA family heavy metal efflux RND transporter [Sesbania bispinosa]|nr:CusA/CzcA family heavy metal efflux RND transporter [Sesbania bispinosa]